MFAEARAMLERAEHLRRRFFELADNSGASCWEPPVDIIETGDGLFIEVALPGVDPARIEINLIAGGLHIVAERQMPQAPGSVVIQRLEIPYGRFERKISLSSGRFSLVRRELLNGCLELWLHRLG
jgi:HSP20 family molecular chaperone IbpA